MRPITDDVTFRNQEPTFMESHSTVDKIVGALIATALFFKGKHMCAYGATSS